ncbi:hypothetical protein [Halobaculum gomorrense]|uniref:Small CPxCG-related zinc finger protein n=1 Tax=Halobaculum gomorrense TaxID=43928 RepID=A0A1M5MJS2_9EURY|nr:hypothetical protein [Halobaculum gomorrense]SHG77491.1 hypothetical protein SAMN05443636_1036 [Halobaculum gomorrense]
MNADRLRYCPKCGELVLFITTRGPDDHRATPCGCRVGSYRLEEFEDAEESRRAIADGGRLEHRAVDGGFECECGAKRRTPLGIARHRANCRRTGGESA